MIFHFYSSLFISILEKKKWQNSMKLLTTKTSKTHKLTSYLNCADTASGIAQISLAKLLNFLILPT